MLSETQGAWPKSRMRRRVLLSTNHRSTFDCFGAQAFSLCRRGRRDGCVCEAGSRTASANGVSRVLLCKWAARLSFPVECGGGSCFARAPSRQVNKKQHWDVKKRRQGTVPDTRWVQTSVAEIKPNDHVTCDNTCMCLESQVRFFKIACDARKNENFRFHPHLC